MQKQIRFSAAELDRLYGPAVEIAMLEVARAQSVQRVETALNRPSVRRTEQAWLDLYNKATRRIPK